MRVVFNRLLSIARQTPSGKESISRLRIRVGLWIKVILLLFLAAYGAKAFSSEKITDQQPDKVSINVEPFSSIFIDPKSSLDLDQINDLNYLFRFAPWQKELLLH